MDDLVEVAKRILKTAGDPVSAVIKFLQERPENVGLPGYLINKILLEAFGTKEEIPSLVNMFSNNVREIIRQANVINIVRESQAIERWGNYLIKQKERIKFEVGKEKGKVVLKNIAGLVYVEHGIEVPLDKILINPPKLEVTVRLGILRPMRQIDMA